MNYKEIIELKETLTTAKAEFERKVKQHLNNIPNTVRELSKERGINLDRWEPSLLSRVTGCAEEYPTIADIVKLSLILNTTPDYLLGFYGDNKCNSETTNDSL